jgi:hypothetical protein
MGDLPRAQAIAAATTDIKALATDLASQPTVAQAA